MIKGNYKLDRKKKGQWLEAYEKTKSVVSACRAVGISRQAIYDLLKKDREFAEQKDEINHLLNETVESRLFSMTKHNPTAAFFWLCNRCPDRWHNVNKMEVSGNSEKPLKIILEGAGKIPGNNNKNHNGGDKV